MLYAGQVLNERYQIIKEIGKGGMSTVYQARDLSTGNLLAVKDVKRTGKEANQAIEQSLVTEGNMLMKLSNSHLPRIYDIIENADSFMMVMDFIEGESLDKVIARDGAQPMDRVLDWGMQICEVFEYLHNQPTPIIYRDMKPANVILKPDGHLMMIDFGTARTQKFGVVMAADTLCLGTAGFAAPEQFGGFGQSTPKTDIFCLGATLYNMITGHSPSDRPQGILPLEKWNPALKDTPISYIIYKCTRNDPEQRYQTARELYNDLHRARNGKMSDPSTWGNSGKLTGALKGAWQKQELKTSGASGALSGLLSFGKNSAQDKKSHELANRIPQQNTAGWQTGTAVPVQSYSYQSPAGAQPYINVAAPAVQPDGSPWRKITLIGLLIAVAMVVLGVTMILLSMMTLGLVFIIFALGAAVLALIGLIFIKRDES